MIKFQKKLFKNYKKILSYNFFFGLTILLVILIIFGSILRHHYLGGQRFQSLQKLAVFFAEIPFHIKHIIKAKSLYGSKILPLNDIVYENKISFNKKLNSNYEELILLSRHDGNENKSIVEIRNINTFEKLHVYDPNISDLIKNSKSEDLKYFKRFYMWHPIVTSDGGLIIKNNSSLIKIDFNSKLVWINDEREYNHSTEIDSEGNIYVPGWKRYLSKQVADYVGTKSSKINNEYIFKDDHINIINKYGKMLFSKSVAEIFIENGYGLKIFPQFDKFVKDPIHLNDIQPVIKNGPYYKKGDLFLSLRNLNMIILYRPSSNKIIKIIQGPFINQHDVDIIDENTISIFNNNTFNNYKNEKYVKNNNEIIFYNFETNTFSKKFENILKNLKVKTVYEGLVDYLKDGSLLVEDTGNGRIILINKNEELVWEYLNLDSDKRIHRLWWSRVINLNNLKKFKKRLYESN